MSRLQFTKSEVRLAGERRIKYQGTAKISIDQISFHPTVNTEIDEAKLDRIERIFRKEKCRRLNIGNHVTAVVSSEYLQIALNNAAVTSQMLLTSSPDHLPSLRFGPGQLQCLHGKHRLKVAKKLLPSTDRWWTVDIYLDNISNELRTSLLDEYSNEKPPNDGEVYRKLRQYDREHNDHFRKRWWSRLSDNKERRLKAFLLHDQFRDAFDDLLVIPGLWSGFRIGSLGTLNGLDEEILNYVHFIKESFCSFVGDDPNALMRVDQRTVEALQLKAPGISKVDKQKIHGEVSSGRIFSQFSQNERDAIWKKLEAFDRMVPSLYTFFEDFKYLTACAQGVQRLIDRKKRSTSVWTAMEHMLQPAVANDEECLIQVSEKKFETTCGNRLDLGYRQIWIYAMRHYPQMARDPQKEDVLAKAPRERADEVVIHEMAVLAKTLGFESEQITALINQSPDRQIAHAALLKARKPDRYEFDPERLEGLISRITGCFSQAIPRESEPFEQQLVIDTSMKDKARCGLPQARVHQQDRSFLFLNHMHNDYDWAGDQISTLFVRRCVYFAFFGTASLSSDSSSLAQDIPSPVSSLFCSPEASGPDPLADAEFDEAEFAQAGDPGQMQVDKVAGLENQLAEQKNEIRRLVEENTELERLRSDAGKVTELDSQLAERDNEIRRLREQNTELERLRSDAGKITELDSQLAERDNEIRRLGEENTLLERLHTDAADKATGLENRVAEQVGIIRELRKQNAQLEHLRSDAAGKVTRLENKVAELEDEIRRLGESQNTQLVQTDKRDDEIQRLHTQLKFDTATKARLQKRIDTLLEKQKNYEEHIGRLNRFRDDSNVLQLPTAPVIIPQEISVSLMLYTQGHWAKMGTIEVTQSDPLRLERELLKKRKNCAHKSEKLDLYDCHLRSIRAADCLRSVQGGPGANTILMSVEPLPNTAEFRADLKKTLDALDTRLIKYTPIPEASQEEREDQKDQGEDREKRIRRESTTGSEELDTRLIEYTPIPEASQGEIGPKGPG